MSKTMAAASLKLAAAHGALLVFGLDAKQEHKQQLCVWTQTLTIH